MVNSLVIEQNKNIASTYFHKLIEIINLYGKDTKITTREIKDLLLWEMGYKSEISTYLTTFVRLGYIRRIKHGSYRIEQNITNNYTSTISKKI